MTHPARRHRGVPGINGQKIYRLRCEAGLSGAQLAIHATTPDINISPGVISKAEAGQPIEPARLAAIAAALSRQLGYTITTADLIHKDQS